MIISLILLGLVLVFVLVANILVNRPVTALDDQLTAIDRAIDDDQKPVKKVTVAA